MGLAEDLQEADHIWTDYRRTGDLTTLREELLTNPIVTNLPDGHDYFVHAALQDGDVAAADLLIELGLLDVRKESSEGYHYLHSVIEGGADPAVVAYLLDRGADIERHGVNDWTPLHMAAVRGRADIVELLLDRGADVNARTRIDGRLTPLMKAAWHGRAEMVRLLVRRGADRFLKNDMGETAADCAAQNGHPELARLLREWSWR